jgi:hypothetical protein
MGNQTDFERAWQAKLSTCVKRTAGLDVAGFVLAGGESLTDESPSSIVVRWTGLAARRLLQRVGDEAAGSVMTGCACRYPTAALLPMRKAFEETGDVDKVLQMLQERFLEFLRRDLSLPEDLISRIGEQNWGLAGVRKGTKIIATKIPKSGNIRDYFATDDPQERRRLYCHCPRIREAVDSSHEIPSIYCYCGAGYYKALWEEILQMPVEVEVLENVLQGGECCRIAVHLPRSVGLGTTRSRKPDLEPDTQ